VSGGDYAAHGRCTNDYVTTFHLTERLLGTHSHLLLKCCMWTSTDPEMYVLPILTTVGLP